MENVEVESSIDYLRRWIGWLDYEYEGILQALPSINAVYDYTQMLSACDVDFLQGVWETEQWTEGPFKDFCIRHNLDWYRKTYDDVLWELVC